MIARLAGSFGVRLLITVLVLGLLFSRLDLAATAAAIGRLSARSAIAVLALVALDRVVMIWRWIVLLRAAGQQISTKSATWIYLVSSFVGGFLPAGIGADLARAYSLTQRTAQGGAAIASVAADRLLGLVSIVLVGAAGAVAWKGGQSDSRSVLIAGAAVCAAASGAMLWADLWVGKLIPTSIRERRLGIRIMRYASALGAYRAHRGAMLMVLLLSICVQLLRIGQAYLLGRGIGIEVPFEYYLVFMPIGLIALLLPISVSGFGAPQGIIVWLLQPAGVPAADAFALSTLIVLSGIAANLPGALLYLRRKESLA